MINLQMELNLENYCTHVQSIYVTYIAPSDIVTCLSLSTVTLQLTSRPIQTIGTYYVLICDYRYIEETLHAFQWETNLFGRLMTRMDTVMYVKIRPTLIYKSTHYLCLWCKESSVV